MTGESQKTAQPSWLLDNLEGHLGNALQVRAALKGLKWGVGSAYDTGQEVAMKERLDQMLADLAARMDRDGIREFKTARGEATLTRTGVIINNRSGG